MALTFLFPGFVPHALILPLQLIVWGIAVDILIDILIRIIGQRAAQLTHDLKGLQVFPQRFQRADMEDRPSGFIKFPSQDRKSVV